MSNETNEFDGVIVILFWLFVGYWLAGGCEPKPAPLPPQAAPVVRPDRET